MNLTKTGELDPKNYGHVEIYEDPTNSQLIAVKTLFQLNENPDVIHEIQELCEELTCSFYQIKVP